MCIVWERTVSFYFNKFYCNYSNLKDLNDRVTKVWLYPFGASHIRHFITSLGG